MPYPWSEFLQLGLVVSSAFYPEIRERKGPILRVLKKLAADSFFQAMEFSGAEERSVQKEIIDVLKTNGKTLVFPGDLTVIRGKTTSMIWMKKKDGKP